MKKKIAGALVIALLLVAAVSASAQAGFFSGKPVTIRGANGVAGQQLKFTKVSKSRVRITIKDKTDGKVGSIVVLRGDVRLGLDETE